MSMEREQFIATYVASWLAARAVQQYGQSELDYILLDELPIDAAGRMAEHAWLAYEDWKSRTLRRDLDKIDERARLEKLKGVFYP